MSGELQPERPVQIVEGVDLVEIRVHRPGETSDIVLRGVDMQAAIQVIFDEHRIARVQFGLNGINSIRTYGSKTYDIPLF